MYGAHLSRCPHTSENVSSERAGPWRLEQRGAPWQLLKAHVADTESFRPLEAVREQSGSEGRAVAGH